MNWLLVVPEHGPDLVPVVDGVAHVYDRGAQGYPTAAANRGHQRDVGARVVGHADVDGDDVPPPEFEAGVVDGLVDAPVLAQGIVAVLVGARLLTHVELVRRDA